MGRVLLSKQARDDLDRLDPSVADRIREKLGDEIAENPQRYTKPLRNRPESRIRIGDYRVICDLDGEELRVFTVEKRDTVYE